MILNLESSILKTFLAAVFLATLQGGTLAGQSDGIDDGLNMVLARVSQMLIDEPGIQHLGCFDPGDKMWVHLCACAHRQACINDNGPQYLI